MRFPVIHDVNNAFNFNREYLMETTENSFWQYDVAFWFGQRHSSEDGLSQEEVNRILADRGMGSKTRSVVKKNTLLFLAQFKSPLMLLLIAAVILSAFLGDVSDVLIILSIVVSTGLISFFLERNAGNIVEKLQSLVAIKTRVLRNGVLQEIPSEQIVRGDIIVLKAGDRLPADCLIIEANELHVNESGLTGESFPVRKEPGVLEATTPLAERTNCLWEGTHVVSGDARALVMLTGAQTLFGSIAQSVSRVSETTFEKGIKDFGFLLMKITIVLAFFILLINLLNHEKVIESALFALALAVGMAPELLPAITTIAMSAGAKRLFAKGVIVKKLDAIQNLGEVNLLCTDKTGTITEGEIKIMGLMDGEGNESEFVKQLAFWNAALENGYSNPIDEALKRLKPVAAPVVQKIGEIPYGFIRKRLSVAVSWQQEKMLISKGAFAQILGICSKIRLDHENIEELSFHKQRLEDRFAEYGRKGIRVIAICYKYIDTEDISRALENNMIFAGFILMEDPVKPVMPDTLKELRQLKVGLKIITGDNKNIAEAIALQTGIKKPLVMTGAELLTTSPEALRQRVKRVHVFAEVEPQQKERIILALKKSYAVAYMGDGINDVSALHAADVGISVDNAVDVAREAADFVLMEKNLMVLAEGIKEGRKTFANTLKYIYINTGATFGNMFSMAFASLILPFLPMLPKQILLTNFITDLPFLSVSSDNVDQEQLHKPGKWDIRLIRRYMIFFGIHSSLFDVITFLSLLYIFKVGESAFQTAWFVESVLTELLILFIIRTHENFLKSKPGRLLRVLGLTGLLVALALPYSPLAKDLGMTPLPMMILVAMLLIVAAYAITADLLKIWFFKRFQRH
ncbi:MAG: magnesium-translocating P-type ATPase [Chitinophagaceae bacterium]|nr:magnesium-translocating P-type ATPase [Chitinophagaceae bacterium]